MSDTTDEMKATLDLDYNFWASMPGWLLAEAAALLLDIDPDKIPKGSLQDAIPGSREWHFHRLHRRLRRARTMREIGSPSEPVQFLNWAISNKLTVSQALRESVESQHSEILTDWQKKFRKLKSQHNKLAAQVEEVVKPKERNSLLRMVLGMARSKFNHTSERSAVKAIEDALFDCGLPVSDDVIRKFLAEAEEKFSE